MNKRIVCLSLCILIALSLVSCGSSVPNEGYYSSSYDGDMMAPVKGDIAGGLNGIFDGFSSSKGDYAESVSDSVQWNDAETSSPSNSYDEVESDNASQDKEEKLVYTSTVDIQTKNMTKALDSIYDLIDRYGGIIQTKKLRDTDSIYYDDEYVAYYGTSRKSASSAYIFVRIPQEHYEEFLSGLNSNDSNIFITDTTEDIQNMTDVYYDIQTRKQALEVERDRLFSFLEQAVSITEILEIEDRITDVQYEIESIQNRMNTIDNDVDYAKITLNIREVLKYTDTTIKRTFFDRLKGYFKESGDGILDTLENLLEAGIIGIPQLLIYGVLIFFIVFVYKKIHGAYRKKHPKKERRRRLNSILTKDFIGETESEDSDNG